LSRLSPGDHCMSSVRGPVKGWSNVGRFDLVRLYYYAEFCDETRDVQILDVPNPQQVDLGDGRKLLWMGRDGRRIAVFRFEPESPGTPPITGSSNGKEWWAKVTGTARQTRVRFRWNADSHSWKGFLPEGIESVTLTTAVNVRTYGGFVDFHDVPAPVLD